MLKKMKLTLKLAVMIGGILILVFAVLIAATVMLSGSAISESIHGELTALSRSNANQIQQIFSSAGSVAQDMEAYLERAYQIAEDEPSQMVVPRDPTTAGLCQSSIYGRTLTILNYDVENYISETARNAAKNNGDIAGVGVMFEPNAFQENMRDYAFYVDETQADNPIRPYGAYEEYSQQPYYLGAKGSKKAVVTKPYDYNGEPRVTYAVPILKDGEVQGVIMSDIALGTFNKVDATSERYTSMFANIFNSAGEIVFDSEDSANIGATTSDFTNDAARAAQIDAQMSQGAAFQTEMVRSDNGEAITMFFTPIAAGSETWWSMTAVNTRDVNAAVVSTATWLIILSVVALILIDGVIIFALRKMLAPMGNIVQAAEQIAGGKLDVRVASKSEDEIGLLCISFQKMSDRLKAMVADLSYLLKEISGGNFGVDARAEEAYVGEFEPLLSALRQTVGDLSDTMRQIRQAADQVSSGAGQVSSGAQALSQGAAEQASAIEELAAGITEVSGQVGENARSARSAREAVDEVGGKVAQCSLQMRQMTEAMGGISASSAEIGKIIKTIEDIAFQTNILALNAAVEAARAGEAGKGFAVVADEVRNLAGKSSEASKSTSALIQSSLKAVENGTAIAEKTAAALQAVVEGTQKITEQVKQIADASDTQASSIAQITQGVDQISAVVQTNSATAEQSAAASEELTGQAQMMESLVDRFKLKA